MVVAKIETASASFFIRNSPGTGDIKTQIQHDLSFDVPVQAVTRQQQV
jgi:hypothetical protein